MTYFPGYTMDAGHAATSLSEGNRARISQGFPKENPWHPSKMMQKIIAQGLPKPVRA